MAASVRAIAHSDSLAEKYVGLIIYNNDYWAVTFHWWRIF
jgi:hypothetical protein